MEAEWAVCENCGRDYRRVEPDQRACNWCVTPSRYPRIAAKERARRVGKVKHSGGESPPGPDSAWNYHG